MLRPLLTGALLLSLLSGGISPCAFAQKDSAPANSTAAGKELFAQKCAVCHLETGQGVPGAFPPLNVRLAQWVGHDSGRDYLVGVLSNGLFGSIQVGAETYMGAMPGMASQLDPSQTADVLNYVLVEFAGATTSVLFSTAEVEQIRGRIGQQQSRSLRPDD